MPPHPAMRSALLGPLLLFDLADVGGTTTTVTYTSLDAKCNGESKYVHSSTYGARVSTWGHVTRGGWRGAVLGPDGTKIYGTAACRRRRLPPRGSPAPPLPQFSPSGELWLPAELAPFAHEGIPTNATTILEIDPSTRTISTFGDLGTALTQDACSGELHCGDDKWIGGVLAPTGKIIGIPYAAETVLEIDPVTRSATTFGVVASPVRRKWVEGVLADNGNVYAIPYDANQILEIDPATHAIEAFGDVGFGPCKWYGGVVGPNRKIYAIPYASQYVLQIDPADRTGSIFAVVEAGWGKWAGGVLANNGKIYGIPALSTSILEIDTDAGKITNYGMLPETNLLEDRWNGGVLAPNGKIYGIPWRSSSVIEFDPETKSISMLGKITATNFTWHGGVVIHNGRIVAVPYNSAWILEIGERVCMESEEAGAVMKLQATQPAAEPQLAQHFVLALPGCPDTITDTCFNFGHRTWHSVMITVMKPDTSLSAVREQVALSRFEHIPSHFCFLFKGHAFDPSVEGIMKANKVAIRNDQQLVIFADSTHCTIGPSSLLGTTQSRPHEQAMIVGILAAVMGVLVAFRVGVHCQKKAQGYKKVPFEADGLVSEESSRLCYTSKITKKGKACKSRGFQAQVSATEMPEVFRAVPVAITKVATEE